MISVIVPVYNVEKYIRRCIESILIQEYRNFELILVDDGSTDSSGDICEEYAKDNNRITVIHQENKGLSGARNTGISNAKGEWVVFIDSDDYISKTMLGDLYDAAINNNVTLAMCDFQCIDETGKDTGESTGSPIKNECVDSHTLLKRLYRTGGWFYIVAWNKIYHRSLLDEEFYPIEKLHEDEFVIAELIWKAKTVVCIDKKDYYYVTQRPGSIMHGKQIKLFLDLLEALSQRFMFLSSIEEYELATLTRRLVFKRLEIYYVKNCGRHRVGNIDNIIKSTLKCGKSIYRQIPGRTVKEEIRWILFCLVPFIETKL